MLVFYPLYFFFRTRLNSGLTFILELCNPYLTGFAILAIVSTVFQFAMNFHTKLSEFMSDDFQNRSSTPFLM